MRESRPIKKFLGLPIRWDRKNMFKNWWNKEEERIFPEKYFGIGWDINFYALFKSIGLIKANKLNSKDTNDNQE